MKVLHIITGLGDGGAEAVLFRLCKYDENNEHYVVSLNDYGKYGCLLVELGVPVFTLQLNFFSLHKIFELKSLIREVQPSIIQTWMYHADFVGAICAYLAGNKNVYWGIHNTSLDLGKAKKKTLVIAFCNAIISRFLPKKIISCSRKGVVEHVKMGFSEKNFYVIPNGYDLSLFSPDEKARKRIRKSFGMKDSDLLIGMVGRFDPYKDHRNLLEGLSYLKEKGIKYKCLLVGQGMDFSNEMLMEWIQEFRLFDEIMILGPRTGIPALMNALDIHVLSSFREAFPNVLCEAMACGTPCVSTRVGDSIEIIGNAGWLVQPKDPVGLSKCIEEAANEKKYNIEGWRQRQIKSREHIMKNFSITRMVNSYDFIWKS